MHSQPRSIAADALAADAAALMEQHGTTSVLVTEPALPAKPRCCVAWYTFAT